MVGNHPPPRLLSSHPHPYPPRRLPSRSGIPPAVVPAGATPCGGRIPPSAPLPICCAAVAHPSRPSAAEIHPSVRRGRSVPPLALHLCAPPWPPGALGHFAPHCRPLPQAPPPPTLAPSSPAPAPAPPPTAASHCCTSPAHSRSSAMSGQQIQIEGRHRCLCSAASPSSQRNKRREGDHRLTSLATRSASPKAMSSGGAKARPGRVHAHTFRPWLNLKSTIAPSSCVFFGRHAAALQTAASFYGSMSSGYLKHLLKSAEAFKSDLFIPP